MARPAFACAPDNDVYRALGGTEASSADIGWGAWSIEAGWCQAWTAVTLDLRARGTSFWKLTEGSRIVDRMPAVQKLMEVNTGGPWGE